jgi:hypothetical protein
VSKKDKKSKGKDKDQGGGRVFVHGSISKPVYRLRTKTRPAKYLRSDGHLVPRESRWGDAKTFETRREAEDYRKTCVVDGDKLIVAPERRIATYCPDCTPRGVRKNMGEWWVDTWEVGSSGWTDVPVCDVCRVAILVYVDGEEGSEVGQCRE